jgi:hypothetical protein
LPYRALTDITSVSLPDYFPKHVFEKALNVTIAGLNFMGGRATSRWVPSFLSKTQKFAAAGIARKMCFLVSRLDADGTVAPPIVGAFARMVGRSADTMYPDLMSDRIELPKVCGRVDVSVALTDEHKSMINDMNVLFPNGTRHVPRRVAFRAGPRHEYIAYVARQLLSGRVRLSCTALGAADIFVVWKSDGFHQRPIWNGRLISQAAAAPPKPPLLTCPTALTNLEASEDRPVYCSGRDGETFFDQLKLEGPLQQMLGQPAVRIEELLAWRAQDGVGLDLEQLKGLVICDGVIDVMSEVTPVQQVWPMGFAWSSFIAQSVMISSLKHAEIDERQILTNEGSLPIEGEDVFSVCTDDVLAFRRLSHLQQAECCAAPMDKIDHAWRNMNIVRKEDKCFDMKLNCTALGLQVFDGIAIGPKINKLRDVLGAMIDLLRDPTASPMEISSFLGSLHWHDLLARGLLSCFSVVYALVRSQPEHDMMTVWPTALAELCLNVALFPMWLVSWTRPWSGDVVATDASPSFGFGVVLGHTHPSVARTAAHVAGNGNHCIRLRGSETTRKNRGGTSHELPLRAEDFKTLLSVRAKRTCHSGALEGEAVLLALRRLTRSSNNHGKRTLILVDALAVLGALKRGRTSAPTLKSATKRIAAIILAADILPRYGYIPSEDNPADAPSRGRRREKKRYCRHRGVALLPSERRLAAMTRAWARLERGGRSCSVSCRPSDATSVGSF